VSLNISKAPKNHKSETNSVSPYSHISKRFLHFALVAMLRSFSDLQKRNHLTIQGTESEKQANKSFYIGEFSGMPFQTPIHLL
jgi:hypothetical protein